MRKNPKFIVIATNIEVTLPLSPTMCARVTHAPGADYIDIGAEMVDEMNMRTLYRCCEVFISENPSLGVEWLGEDRS